MTSEQKSEPSRLTAQKGRRVLSRSRPNTQVSKFYVQSAFQQVTTEAAEEEA